MIQRPETALDMARRINERREQYVRDHPGEGPPWPWDPPKIPASAFSVRECLSHILPAIFDRHCPDCRSEEWRFRWRTPPAYRHSTCWNFRGRISTAFWWTMILLRLRTDLTDGGSISGGRWTWRH